MATATKKAPAKKAAAKQTKAEDTTEETAEDRRAAREAVNAELTEQIVNMRDAGEKWAGIAESLGITTAKAMWLHMQASANPKERITGKSDEELAAKIAKARTQDLLSWGQIMVRTGLSESRCRSLFEQASGESSKGNRVGRGGRYPEGTTPPARASESREKATKKAAAAKKAPAKAKNPLFDMESSALEEHLVGQVVSFKQGGKTVKARVAEAQVTGTGPDAEVVITSDKGNSATIVVKNITRVAAR